jgi:hypothetical protein
MVRWAKTLLFILGASTFAGCGEDASPLSPSPGAPRVVSVTIAGTTSFDHPGETSQLTATARFSDNTSRDVTAEASWHEGLGVFSIAGPGLITARRYGTDTVVARYLTVSGSAWVRVAPAGAFLVSGSVTSAGGFRLSQARVEFSSRCGTHSMTTDDSGDYVMPAQGEATMRAEREGMGAQVRQMTVVRDMRVDFELQPLDTPGDPSGAYRLTVTASASCVLPPEVMQRSYDGRLLQIGRDLFVILTGPSLIELGGTPGFTGSRDGNAVQFVVRDTFDEGYNFIERIAGTSTDGTDLYYSGTASGEAGQTRIVAVFSGTLDLRSHGKGTGIAPAKCEAADHRFELTRN